MTVFILNEEKLLVLNSPTYRYFGHSYKQYLIITNQPETRNNTTKMGAIKFTTDSDLMILSSGDFCGLLKNRCLLLQELLCKGRREGERGSLKSYLRLMLLARSQTLVVQPVDVFYSFWKMLRLFFFPTFYSTILAGPF